MPTGRPTKFSEEIATVICERLADGKSLRSICAAEDMPDKATVLRWVLKHEAFRDQYAVARATQADTLFDEILDIADDGTNDWMERRGADGADLGWQFNGEAARRSQIRIDARKWMAGKLAPKKYGEKQSVEVSGPDGKPIQTESISDRERAKAFLALIGKAEAE